MGVSNIQKYTITKHAIMRIQTRFNIPKTKIPAWVTRFMNQATFFKTDDSNDAIQIYKNDEVLMVLNVEEFTVVTAYPYNPFNKTNGLSKEIMHLLQPSLDKIVGEERVRLRDDLDGLMVDLQMTYLAFQTHPKSEVFLKEFLTGFDKINQRIKDSETLIKDIKGLKE